MIRSLLGFTVGYAVLMAAALFLCLQLENTARAQLVGPTCHSKCKDVWAYRVCSAGEVRAFKDEANCHPCPNLGDTACFDKGSNTLCALYDVMISTQIFTDGFGCKCGTFILSTEMNALTPPFMNGAATRRRRCDPVVYD